MSPLLFALYLNDLHQRLDGGLYIDEINIRLLLYADDNVLLADDPLTLQNMINKLENYCMTWNMEVNLSKSEIMVFRKGGRLSSQEMWTLNSERIKIVSEYTYLGVLLTPKMSFTKHVDKRNNSAKSSVNSTWKAFVGKGNISLESKWRLFQAVCRAIQTYGAQVWGFKHFEDVDKLQRYFLKRILKLPSFTPNYCIALETGLEESHYFSQTYTSDIYYVCCSNTQTTDCLKN